MDQLIQLEQSLLVPHNRRDKELLNRLLTDDFLEMGASGKLFGKDVVLENLPSEEDTTHFEGRDFNVRYLGEDVGVVTFIVTKFMADTPPAEASAPQSGTKQHRVGRWCFIRERHSNLELCHPCAGRDLVGNNDNKFTSGSPAHSPS